MYNLYFEYEALEDALRALGVHRSTLDDFGANALLAICSKTRDGITAAV